MEELFEFDLSDVDVAAFENVASTPPHSTSPTPPQPQTSSDATIPEAPILTEVDKDGVDIVPEEPQDHPPPTTSLTEVTPVQPATQEQQQQQPQQLQQIATAAGQRPCKILLIPINSKQTNKQVLQQLQQYQQQLHLQQHQQQLQQHHQQQQQQHLNQHHQQLRQQQELQQQQQLQLQQQQQQQQQLQQQQQQQLMIANEVPKRKPCNCTKSQCLKLYCDCFANGEFCSGCNCTNCSNSLDKEKERQKAITQCLERNPEAFRPKIGKAVKASLGEPAPESIERRHTKGCNCKRSGCLKNYCECYEAKILCSNLCKCCGCKNYEESFERKTLMQLANSSPENARGILKNLLPTNNGSTSGKEFAKCFITDQVIQASMNCLLQTAQQAEKDGIPPDQIPTLIQQEMGRCLRMIVNTASESSISRKK